MGSTSDKIMCVACFQSDIVENGGSVDKRDQECGIGQELRQAGFQQTNHQTLTGMTLNGETSRPACITELAETMAGTHIPATHVQKISSIYAKRIS